MIDRHSKKKEYTLPPPPKKSSKCVSFHGKPSKHIVTSVRRGHMVVGFGW